MSKAETILLSTEEACAALGHISRRTLWNWTNRPENPVPHVKLGTRVMYDVADLRRWVDAQKNY